VIPVALADEPKSFDGHVRERGTVAIRRLLGKKVNAAGRQPTRIYARPEDIPADKFPAYWTEVRQSDDKSALDDMMDAYGQCCAYLALRLERATGSPTVDHYVPKVRDWRRVYEWSNYRLCTGCVNGAKGTKDVVDPFQVKPGWFELDLDTFLVRRGDAAPVAEHARIDETLTILNLRQCVRQRGDFITRYRMKKITLAHVKIYAPFIESELRRQGKLVRGKGTP
jgi:hypothetical protein